MSGEVERKIKMTDFETIVNILAKAKHHFEVEEVEGDHPCLNIPSAYPEVYDTGVTFSFNEDGSLYCIHSYVPEL